MSALARIVAVLAVTVPLVACAGDERGSAPGDTTGDDSAHVTTGTTTDTNDQGADRDEPQMDQSCSNARAGLEVRYPAGWHADSRCEWFHPEAFELPRNQDRPGIAIHLREEPVSLETATAGGPMSEVISREREMVDGRDAVRMETRLTERGLMPAGTRALHWTIRVDDDSSIRGSTFSVGDHDFDESRRVLDAMIDALQIRE